MKRRGVDNVLYGSGTSDREKEVGEVIGTRAGESARLRKQLEEARRANRRTAVPFSWVNILYLKIDYTQAEELAMNEAINENVIDIYWHGPMPIQLKDLQEELTRRKLESAGGVYAIYGPHYVYGHYTLLYIGKADRFVNRIKDHIGRATSGEKKFGFMSDN